MNIGEKDEEGSLPDSPGTTVTDPAPTAANTTPGTAAPDAPFLYVEEMPEFNGGEKAMFSFLSRHINYPAPAQRAGVEGIVVVTFVISPSGEIKDAQVLKGLGYGTDEEALRVVNSMPEWKPGKQNGKAVPVRYTLPIRFHLK